MEENKKKIKVNKKTVFKVLAAQNDAAFFCAEFRLVFVRAAASRTRIRLCQRPAADAAVLTAGSDHLSSKHFFCHFLYSRILSFIVGRSRSALVGTQSQSCGMFLSVRTVYSMALSSLSIS